MNQVSDYSRPRINHANRPSKRRRPSHDNRDDSKTRMRVTQACNECRKRKDRCDGARPSCSRCVSGDRPCRYNQSNKKRGLRGGYVRTLEILLGLIFNTIEGSETWIASILANKTTIPSFHLRLIPEFTKDAAETSLSLWRRSQVLAELERLGLFDSAGADEDESSDRLNERLSDSLAQVIAASQVERETTRNDNPTVVFPESNATHVPDLAIEVSETVQDPMILDDHILQQPEEHNSYSESQPLGSLTGNGSQHPNECFPLPSDWEELLNKYFHTTHSWLPIAEKHELLRISYSLRAIEAPAIGHTTSSRGDNAFLAAAFAYVIQREQNNVRATRNKEMLCLSTYANDLLDFPGDSNELGHVRALLLLTLAHIDNGKWDQAWRTVGRAVYMMVSLLDITDAMTMATAEEGQKRTLLGCYALEALITVRLKRRTYLSYSDVQKLGLLSTNTVEEWEPWHSSKGPGTDGRQTALGRVISLFNHLMRLLSMMHELQLETGNAAAQDLAACFQDWKAQLQQTHETTLSPHSPPQLLNLSAAVTTMQTMTETRVTTQLSPTTLDELSLLVETLEHQMLSNNASTRSLVPSTVDMYLQLIEESLSRQSPNETASIQDRIDHVLSSITRLRNVKREIKGQSRTQENLATGPLGGDSIISNNSAYPQPNNVPPATASLQPPSIGNGLWDVDDDDMLFDTMATLDSTNWIDNLPDFVRGLGSVRTTSPDLQALIDGAF